MNGVLAATGGRETELFLCSCTDFNWDWRKGQLESCRQKPWHSHSNLLKKKKELWDLLCTFSHHGIFLLWSVEWKDRPTCAAQPLAMHPIEWDGDHRILEGLQQTETSGSIQYNRYASRDTQSRVPKPVFRWLLEMSKEETPQPLWNKPGTSNLSWKLTVCHLHNENQIRNCK